MFGNLEKIDDDERLATAGFTFLVSVMQHDISSLKGSEVMVCQLRRSTFFRWNKSWSDLMIKEWLEIPIWYGSLVEWFSKTFKVTIGRLRVLLVAGINCSPSQLHLSR